MAKKLKKSKIITFGTPAVKVPGPLTEEDITITPEDIKEFEEFQKAQAKKAKEKIGKKIDSGAFEAWIDGVIESALIEQQEKNPEIAKKVIEEWEEEHGRKIGTASQEEIEYRNSAWDMPE